VSKKKPKTIDASFPVSLMGCEGKVIVEMTPTEAVLMIEKAWQENKRLRQKQNALRAERDEMRRQRDSARQEVCFLLSRNVTQGCDGDTAEFHATARGWCYLLEEDDE
jgi:hypothetical protein